jgi:exodeoxyribonuclease V beta subunit
MPLDRRLIELEFHLPSDRLSASHLSAVLSRHGYEGNRLMFASLSGYLKGFIDLVFEHEGRFFVLDWKSNFLGYETHDYRREALSEEMTRQGYHLQYLLYCVALQRYLLHRLPAYDPDLHFGGVVYLFIRGVRPHWQQPDGTPSGLFFHRPDPALIGELSSLFPAPHARHA